MEDEKVFLGKVGVGISKEKLMKCLEKEKLQAVDFSREITMIDYGITNNTDKFVTEICIPVKKFG